MVIALALILGIFGIYFSIHDGSEQRDVNLRNAAESTAQIGRIMTAEGKTSEEMTGELDSLQTSMEEIDVISVVGRDGVRLYHSNHELMGTVYDGTMPDFEKNGDCYVVNEEGPSGPQRRAYAAIRGDDGETDGFVMTVMLMSSIRVRNLKVLGIFLGMIILAIAAEFLISMKISKKVSETLMGFEPDVFSAMYKVRDGILESLNEGIVAVDADSGVLFMNKAASRMISGGEKDEEKMSQGTKIITNVLSKEGKEVSIPVNLHNDVDIIIDRHPITEEGETVGAVGIMHDRSNISQLLCPAGLLATGLCRLLGLYRHSHRCGDVDGLLPAHQLQLALQSHQPRRFLETVAHLAQQLAQGLPLHPPWRQPQRHRRHLPYPHRHAAHRRPDGEKPLGVAGRRWCSGGADVGLPPLPTPPQRFHHQPQQLRHHAPRRHVARCLVQLHHLGRTQRSGHTRLQKLETMGSVDTHHCHRLSLPCHQGRLPLLPIPRAEHVPLRLHGHHRRHPTAQPSARLRW